MVASPDERVRLLTIHPVDLGIIIAYLAGMVLVGYLVAGRIRWFTDFFLAGRALTTPILICTLVSSYYGLDALFGDSGDAAREGIVVWFIYGRPYTIALLVAALVVAQKFQGTGFLTISDVLAATYGRATQVAGGIASFLYALPILAMMGLAALGQVLFGLPLWVGAVVGSLVSVAYVAMGGFWADALTDVAQFTIMCVSLAVALPLILDGVGGFAGVRQALGPEPFSPLGTAPPLYTVAYALTAVSVPRRAAVLPAHLRRARSSDHPQGLPLGCADLGSVRLGHDGGADGGSGADEGRRAPAGGAVVRVVGCAE
jgi:Na+/proline symporter